MKHLIPYLNTILDIGSEKIGSKLPILNVALLKVGKCDNIGYPYEADHFYSKLL